MQGIADPMVSAWLASGIETFSTSPPVSQLNPMDYYTLLDLVKIAVGILGHIRMVDPHLPSLKLPEPSG